MRETVQVFAHSGKIELETDAGTLHIEISKNHIIKVDIESRDREDTITMFSEAGQVSRPVGPPSFVVNIEARPSGNARIRTWTDTAAATDRS